MSQGEGTITTAQHRREDRERKRREREARRNVGAPDPGLLDRAIVNAPRDMVVIGLGHADCRPKDVVRAAIQIQSVLQRARTKFHDRGLDKVECDRALVTRLTLIDPSSMKTHIGSTRSPKFVRSGKVDLGSLRDLSNVLG